MGAPWIVPIICIPEIQGSLINEFENDFSELLACFTKIVVRCVNKVSVFDDDFNFSAFSDHVCPSVVYWVLVNDSLC